MDLILPKMPRKKSKEASHTSPFIHVGSDGQIRIISQEALTLLGYLPGETPDRRFFSHVSEHNLFPVVSEFLEFMLNERKSATWIVQLRMAHRGYRWIRIHIRVDGDSPPEIIKMILKDASRMMGTK